VQCSRGDESPSLSQVESPTDFKVVAGVHGPSAVEGTLAFAAAAVNECSHSAGHEQMSLRKTFGALFSLS